MIISRVISFIAIIIIVLLLFISVAIIMIIPTRAAPVSLSLRDFLQEGTGSVRFVSGPDFSKIHRFVSVRSVRFGSVSYSFLY